MTPRSTASTEWKLGFVEDFGDATRALSAEELAAIGTTEPVVVPSVFDNAEPGKLGRRGTAFYRRSFVDQVSGGSSVGRLHFGACSFFCRVFVDGVEIGEHRASGYTPFWLNLPTLPKQATPVDSTDSSCNGVHELLVLVDNRYNRTTAPLHTGGDFYEFGGITRSVTLHQLPFKPVREEHRNDEARPILIDGIAVIPTEDLKHVNVSLRLGGAAALPTSAQLSFNGGTVITVSGSTSGGVLRLDNIAVPASASTPWSVASPTLHNLTVTIAISGDSVTARFGLRTLGVSSNGRITINGETTKLHGFNRHTMSPMSGSALTFEEVKRDVKLLVDVGANFVRGAHYPQDQRFLDLCDEMGILVWEETLGPGTSTQDLSDPYFLEHQVIAVQEMVNASASHPAVIIHGFYNEGPSNDPKACPGYNVSADAVHALMPTSHRMVTWASSQKEKDACLEAADVLSFNDYPAWYTASLPEVGATWAAHSAWAAQHFPQKPFLISETGAGAIYEWKNKTKMLDNYTVYSAALAAGNDLTTKNVTWDGAMSFCNHTASCMGFTFDSTDQRPSTPVKTYFKNSSHVNMDDSWTAWIKGAGPSPRWSQQYQAEVVTADVSAALAVERISGIAVWQFNDIKADPSDFHPRPGPQKQQCKSCTYSTHYNPAAPMNCSSISTSCFRPGGENHKGLVDFWRREKLAWTAAKNLFKSTYMTSSIDE